MSDEPQIFVKPLIPGNLVLKERGYRNFLDQEGEWVSHNVFWATRLLHGDVKDCTAEKQALVPSGESQSVASDPGDSTSSAEEGDEIGGASSRKRARRS